MTPSWMTEDNGLWVNNKTIIVDVLSDFIQNWLEDNINPTLFEQMEKTVSEIQTKEQFEENTIDLFSKMFETRLASFEDQLSKFETV
jgi:DNA topoisomerase IA